MTEQRDERTIGQVQRVADVCHIQGVDIRPLVGEVEQVLSTTKPLREAAEKAGLNSRERKVVAESVANAIREGMR